MQADLARSYGVSEATIAGSRLPALSSTAWPSASDEAMSDRRTFRRTAQLLEALQERRVTGLRFPVVRSQAH